MAGWIAAAVALSACGDDEPRTEPTLPGKVGDDSGAQDASTSAPTDSAVAPTDSAMPTPDAAAPADAGAVDPVYLFQVAVYGPDETLQYDVLRRSLDWNISVNDLKTAKEFPGYTGVAAIHGHVITGDSASPFATKYKINPDLSWEQVGEKLNFSNYFTADADGLNFYFQAIRGADMYFFYGAEKTSRLHWNVDQWKIIGPHEDSNVPAAAPGYAITNTGNRTGMRDYEGPVVWQFIEMNDKYERGNTSYITTYDPATHAETAVHKIDCPSIEQATADEQGNLYFSTTYQDPTASLYGLRKPACVVRVKADGTLDETFAPNDLTAWTGGYQGVNFRYLANGKAVANVLHTERLTGVDFQGPYSADVQCKIMYCEAKPELQDPSLWSLHLIDIATGTSKIITGLEDVGNYAIWHKIDGKAFVAKQIDAATYSNDIYELNFETASLTKVGSIAGELFGVSRVR